jgi:hypothetical protein
MSGGLWLGFAARRGELTGPVRPSESHSEIAELARDPLAPGEEMPARRRSPEGDRGSAALAGMMMAAISGGAAGFLLRGEAFQAALLLMATVSAGYVGWWARGV